MKIIAAGLMVVCSALLVSAQETPVAGGLNEQRVALTAAGGGVGREWSAGARSYFANYGAEWCARNASYKRSDGR
nr:MetaGeneMark_Unknown Function [uncultured bacterium]